MDASLPTFRPRPTSAVAVAVAAVIAGLLAWKLLRPPPPSFTPHAALDPQIFELVGRFSIAPDASSGQISGELTSIRLQPGAELGFDVHRVSGLLAGRFQVVDQKAGAVVELQSVDAQGRRQTILRRALQPADKVAVDAAIVHFLVDPAALPAGTRSIRLAVPASSSGAVDWSEVKLQSRDDSRLLSRLPLPLLAYEGFAEPASDENAIYAHAPMRFVLRVPVGQYGFSTKFGYNPAALSQREGHSDGMEVRIVLESARGTQTLLDRSLDPTRAEDRSLQQANLPLDCPESGQLQLIVAPGPSGIINWDWAMWTDLQVTPAATH